MNSLKVINNSILVDSSSDTEELGNGLSIDAKGNSRRKIIKGIVVKTCSPDVNEGDVVYFPIYSGDEISILGKDYYLINKDDIKLIHREES